MRTLVIVLLALGVVFGAVEVAVVGAADALGGSAAAGPLLGLWGAGSLAGGVVAARMGGGARTGAGLALVSPRWRPATSRSPRPPAARSRSPPS